MDADKIILPDFLIAELYKGCLVDLDTSSYNKKAVTEKNLPSEGVITSGSTDKLKFSGENLKNVTIIINQPDSNDINKKDLTFLTNILKACQLNLADIAIVNTAGQKVTYDLIKEQLGALQIIMFDVEPALIKLPFMIPHFQVQDYAGTAIMMAPALSALNQPDNESRILKTKLWNSLKQVFGIR